MTPRFDVVVIGGGQAGLAIGYHLTRQRRRLTILEAAATPAAAWRERWDSLKLFTPVRFNSLPGFPFPGDPDSYPGRDAVVAYLDEYARRFELPLELSSRVRAVEPDEQGGYRVQLDDRTYETDQVVIATGPFQEPRIPPIAADLDPAVTQFHSVRYRSRARSRPGRCSSSAAGTPATRSPRSSPAITRCTSRSGHGRRRCRSASSAATCSSIWRRRG